jgi:putative transcriptional regulator
VDEPVERFSTATEGPAAGRLLVATPALADPNFSHAVVLLLDHDEDGTLGVVINRPTSVAVAAVLPDWSAAVAVPEVLFEGGPVHTDAALAVAAVTAREGPEPLGFRRLFGSTGIIDLDTPPEVLAPAVDRLRIFAGYAGWGRGQLEDEIADGSWYVVDSAVDDVFQPDPSRLWREVLRRQAGELAWVSTKPVDPTLN